MHRAIDDNFEVVKAYANRVKDTIDADYDSRDEVIDKTYVHLGTFSYEMYQMAKNMDDFTRYLMGLHEEQQGNKKPTDRYTEYWKYLVSNIEHLQKVKAALKTNIPATMTTSVSNVDDI